MSVELTVLTLAALLQGLQFVLYAVPANREIGPGYTMSARDHEPSRGARRGANSPHELRKQL